MPPFAGMNIKKYGTYASPSLRTRVYEVVQEVALCLAYLVL